MMAATIIDNHLIIESCLDMAVSKQLFDFCIESFDYVSISDEAPILQHRQSFHATWRTIEMDSRQSSTYVINILWRSSSRRNGNIDGRSPSSSHTSRFMDYKTSIKIYYCWQDDNRWHDRKSVLEINSVGNPASLSRCNRRFLATLHCRREGT